MLDMADELLLLNPGPVPLSPDVRSAMAEPMVSHRSAAFEADFERAQSGLRYIFETGSVDGSRTATGGTPLLLMGTASLAMEAAVSNLVGPEDTVVALENGKFGRRFRRIAERYATVRTVAAEWGDSFDLDRVKAAIDDDVDLVTMVHNETSTGVLNPVAAVGDVAAAVDARFVVDGVTSIGGDAFHLDEWGVDLAVTDAQKALASPPGISAIYLAEGRESALEPDNGPFYTDLVRHVEKAADNQTPFTSAVPLVRGMATALEEIQAETMPARIARHRAQARAFRAAFAAMDLERFPTIEAPSAMSNTVTAIELPPSVKSDAEAFFAAVAEQNVSISGGQGHLGGDIFRVSNMGNLTDDDIRRGIRALGEALRSVDWGVDIEGALAAADDELEA